MRHVRERFIAVARPQLLVGLVAVALMVIGVHMPHPAALQPLPARGPHVAHVFGSAFSGSHVPPPVARVDCSQQPCLALTFDDGPNAVTTPLVLDALERHHARATFFVIGNRVAGNEALLRRMFQDGHEIGNHSWSHPDFTTLTSDQILQQITQTQAAVVNAGVPAPTLFRPPYGAVNTVVKNRVPLTFAMWNVDPEDWRSKDTKGIVAKVEAGVRPGRVVDLHDIHPQTAASLDQLITDLQKNYQLVTFSELFNLASGEPGLFYGR